jgi:hypothetical protein
MLGAWAILAAGCILQVERNGDSDRFISDGSVADASVAADAPETPDLADAPPPDADLSCFGLEAIPVVLGVHYFGSTVGGPNHFEGCQNSGGPEAYHRLELTEGQLPATLVVDTDLPGTLYDTVLKVWADSCDPVAGTELECNDDGQGDTVELPIFLPGTYYVVIDSHPGDGGDYELLVTLR